MKKLLAVTTIVAGFATMAGAAQAALITINSTTPTWSNIVGGSNTALNLNSGNFLDARWGESHGSGRSGLGFDPASPDRARHGAPPPRLTAAGCTTRGALTAIVSAPSRIPGRLTALPSQTAPRRGGDIDG